MIAPARRAALEALLLADRNESDLGESVARVRQPLTDERDRALLLELVSGTLRMRGAIDYQLARLVSRPLHRLDAVVHTVLRLGAFQLIYLTRIPPSAVVDDAVALTKRSGKTSAAGLVNAVLRALAREHDRLTWPERPGTDRQAEWVPYLSTVHSHPAWLVERWLARHGIEATERWLRFNNQAATLCLASNRTRTSRDRLADLLRAEGIETRATPYAKHGLYVEKGQPMSSRAFVEGLCVIQDEASQLIPDLIEEQPGARMLDLCASPGGKTVSLAAKAGADGLVVASDVRARRLRVLERTLSRCRIDRARVVHIAAAGPLPFRPRAFDAVLIDAPCSGLGTVRRDPDIRWRRAPADLARFAEAQSDLLDRASDLVCPGGTMVYSTCSSEPEENQDVVAAFLSRHDGYAQVREHQTLPFRDQLEAFFAAVLRRSPGTSV